MKLLRQDKERQFSMLLALEFGRADVDDFLDTITRRQYREWLAYYAIQPFGDQRRDLRAAVVARSMAGGELTNFMPFLEEDMNTSGVAAIAALYE